MAFLHAVAGCSSLASSCNHYGSHGGWHVLQIREKHEAAKQERQAAGHRMIAAISHLLTEKNKSGQRWPWSRSPLYSVGQPDLHESALQPKQRLATFCCVTNEAAQARLNHTNTAHCASVRSTSCCMFHSFQNSFGTEHCGATPGCFHACYMPSAAAQYTFCMYMKR